MGKGREIGKGTQHTHRTQKQGRIELAPRSLAWCAASLHAGTHMRGRRARYPGRSQQASRVPLPPSPPTLLVKEDPAAILVENKNDTTKSRALSKHTMVSPARGVRYLGRPHSFSCACRKAIVYHVRLVLTLVPVSSRAQLFSQLVGSCSGLALPGQPARQPARPRSLRGPRLCVGPPWPNAGIVCSLSTSMSACRLPESTAWGAIIRPHTAGEAVSSGRRGGGCVLQCGRGTRQHAAL